MDDYFDWVVAQLVPNQTVLYLTVHGTQYVFLGIGTSRGHRAIVYSINTARKRVSKPFLNAAYTYFLENNEAPSADWCHEHFPAFMNDGYCNYCVLTQIITDYQQPNP
jgi:hypothetical protein